LLIIASTVFVGIVSGQPIPATVTFVNKGTISGFASDPGFSFYNGFGYFFGGYLATTATKVDLASGTLTKTSLPAFSATLRASCAVTTETGTMYIIGNIRIFLEALINSVLRIQVEMRTQAGRVMAQPSSESLV
jgi:hypothetical protein